MGSPQPSPLDRAGRVPWILFQGLVLGLPAAGLILFATWLLRLSGVN